MLNISHPSYGQGDSSFQTAGGELGIRRLVDCFYDQMRDHPDYRTIWDWHPGAEEDDQQKEQSRDKLARFLCSWMGGLKLYQDKYGSISIPQAHRHLAVTEREMGMWLNCMGEALDMQDYPAPFKAYLLEQLSRPAEVIRQACSRNTI